MQHNVEFPPTPFLPPRGQTVPDYATYTRHHSTMAATPLSSLLSSPQTTQTTQPQPQPQQTTQPQPRDSSLTTAQAITGLMLTMESCNTSLERTVRNFNNAAAVIATMPRRMPPPY
eukprot:TRINITY_DN74_c0_g1_i1.p3 TRINITY_DN74_c0_g1~~TRINITY_DN74_c0_g1_i1.p3  ORF type:complete len:116 (-),score=8.04 TRINITY_DN74_c0_g1_i1:93-440(-)